MKYRASSGWRPCMGVRGLPSCSATSHSFASSCEPMRTIPSYPSQGMSPCCRHPGQERRAAHMARHGTSWHLMLLQLYSPKREREAASWQMLAGFEKARCPVHLRPNPGQPLAQFKLFWPGCMHWDTFGHCVGGIGRLDGRQREDRRIARVRFKASGRDADQFCCCVLRFATGGWSSN